MCHLYLNNQNGKEVFMKYTLLAVFAGVFVATIKTYEDQILMPVMMTVVITVVVAMIAFVAFPTAFVPKKKSFKSASGKSSAKPDPFLDH